MKEVAILLLLAIMLNGCGSSGAVQSPSASVWQAQMSGGVGGTAPSDPGSAGFSFNTQFTVSSGGTLSISSFQLLNSDTCYGNVGPNTVRNADRDLQFGRPDHRRHVFL